MQAQKPSWRNAASSPSAARRSSGSRSSTESSRRWSSAPGTQGEEAAVDPVLGPRLLVEPAHAVVVAEQRDAERQLRAHHGHRGQRAGGLVAGAQGGEVDVGDAVGVGGQERRRPRARRAPATAARRSACPAPVSTQRTSTPSGQ